MKSGYGPEPVTEGDMAYDVEKVREDFPILQRRVGQYRLAYLDSANTSQKPRQVVEAMERHYLEHNANVARAMHLLGAEATEAFEGARGKVAGFVKAARPEEIVFTKNASEALNLAAVGSAAAQTQRCENPPRQQRMAVPQPDGDQQGKKDHAKRRHHGAQHTDHAHQNQALQADAGLDGQQLQPNFRQFKDARQPAPHASFAAAGVG